MKHRFTRKLTVTTLFLGVALAGSVAFAAWTTNGSGSGYAKATSAQALTTVDASASTSAQLYPGGTGDLVLKISNPNGYQVTVTAVNNGSGSITSDQGAACNASTGVTFTNTSGLSLVVPAGTTQTFTLAGKVAMSNASDTTCQGAVFTVPVNLVGASS